jgi:hypothetical protein
VVFTTRINGKKLDNSLFSLGYDYANTVLFTSKRRKRLSVKYDSGFGRL